MIHPCICDLHGEVYMIHPCICDLHGEVYMIHPCICDLRGEVCMIHPCICYLLGEVYIVAMLGGPCSQHVTGNTSRQNQPQSAIRFIHASVTFTVKYM